MWLLIVILFTFITAGPAVAVEIEYWQYSYKTRLDVMDKMIEQFEAENSDIKVIHTNFPYAQYRTKVAASVAAGEGPDVVQLYYGWLADYLSKWKQ